SESITPLYSGTPKGTAPTSVGTLISRHDPPTCIISSSFTVTRQFEAVFTRICTLSFASTSALAAKGPNVLPFTSVTDWGDLSNRPAFPASGWLFHVADPVYAPFKSTTSFSNFAFTWD